MYVGLTDLHLSSVLLNLYNVLCSSKSTQTLSVDRRTHHQLLQPILLGRMLVLPGVCV